MTVTMTHWLYYIVYYSLYQLFYWVSILILLHKDIMTVFSTNVQNSTYF